MTDWTEAADKLATQVTSNAPEWRDAVTATPRHVLVPRWWEPTRKHPFEWQLVTPDAADPLSQVYSDETLVTRVGALHADHAGPEGRAHGAPTSSSTLPGLIVRMLHLLDARPGQRVLDIGTGSGYSAALLGYRLGDNRVTSVDVDPYLVQIARERLATFGRAPEIAAVDATGELPGEDYDRMIATVSVRPVPASWLSALRPGGRIVTTIAGTSLLVSAELGRDLVAQGRVQLDPASFMRTRTTVDYPARLDNVYAAARDSDGDQVRSLTQPVPNLWTDWELRALYELDSANIEHRSATDDNGDAILWLLAADGSWARAEEGAGRVHQSGSRRLWDDLDRVRARWEEAGRFPLHQLDVEFTPETTSVTSPDGYWTIQL
ncbi:methyltransferase domain-containing protein [Kribbella albertanoniae]|uniref:Protein-L-isoaspartate O-methyltransferase n=1 Tax=Kribbella albertanoniae TaxID=1266829 RepID=A0A4R4PVP4_9ACTN|nr:methyltransferase domain-containing protein [Kribbella albertanoniae]TDC26540.1 methyltransferase domain-containing protein [Kribbella albertanoniae]